MNLKEFKDINAIIKAVDKTDDKNILEKIWEITKYRLNEEHERLKSAHDRAQRNITYAFSILGFTSVIISVMSGSMHILDKPCFFLISRMFHIVIFALFIIIILKLFSIWNKSLEVLSVEEYRTWNKEDIFNVSIGSKKQAHWRFLIKAGWKIISSNKKITDDKLDKLKKSSAALTCSIKYLVWIIILLTVLKLSVN